MRINKNLIKNSSLKRETSDYIISTWPLSQSLEAGKVYTFSVEIELGEDRSVLFVYTTNNHHEATISPSHYIHGGVLEFTFTAQENRPPTDEFIRLYQYPNSGTSISKVVRAKLEEGTEATLWIPADADLTPEQIATLPPYGEFTEIQAF